MKTRKQKETSTTITIKPPIPEGFIKDKPKKQFLIRVPIFGYWPFKEVVKTIFFALIVLFGVWIFAVMFLSLGG